MPFFIFPYFIIFMIDMTKRNNPDKPRCNCGIIGIYDYNDAALPVYYGLHALQHRGQEAAGIVAAEKTEKNKIVFNRHKDFGLVSEVFSDAGTFESKLKGFAAIGHNRYSTFGSSDSAKNIQPFVVSYRSGNLAVAHNGNLTNADRLRTNLVSDGAIFQTSSDTEVVLHLIARSKMENQVDQALDALNKIEGAYCLLIMTDDKLIAARDPHGFRPLCLGKLGDSYVVASETCAFDINDIEYIREIEPGEVLVIDKDSKKTGEVKSFRLSGSKKEKKQCIFEYIYFSRPDSHIFSGNVDKMRRKLGKVLAKNHPVTDPDEEKVIVISVPDSSNTAAIGYQNQLEKMEIPSKLEIGLIRSHYIGRTFILPGQKKREIGVKIKFNTVKGVLEGRTIVLIDDSVVRGTTSKNLVKLIREANPKSIHLRISSSPILYPCFYGMDFPSRNELLINKFNGDMEAVKEYLGVDTIEYMTIQEMLDAMVDHPDSEFCTACFSGDYPLAVNRKFDKEAYDN